MKYIDITPAEYRCGGGVSSCPSVKRAEDGSSYQITGKNVPTNPYIGGEATVEIDARMLEEAIRGEELTRTEAIEEFCVAVIKRVSELDGRSSPDDWPEAMLVTGDELQHILAEKMDEIGVRAIDQLDAARARIAALETALKRFDNALVIAEGTLGDEITDRASVMVRIADLRAARAARAALQQGHRT